VVISRGKVVNSKSYRAEGVQDGVNACIIMENVR